MGNCWHRCYAEENNQIQEQTNLRIPLINQEVIADTNQNIHENQKTEKQFENLTDFSLLKIQERIYVYHKKFSIKTFHEDLEQVFSQFFNSNDQSLISNNNQLKFLFDTPMYRMFSDSITEFASTQIQIQMAMAMALKKYQSKWKYQSKQKQFLKLNSIEEIIGKAICLNIIFNMIPLFIDQSQVSEQIQNTNFLKLFRSIQIVYLVCDSIKSILDQQLKADSYKQNIMLYNLFYQNYSKLILNLNKDNECFYNDLHNTLNLSKQNNFSLLGYYLRFWCQIVLTKDDQQKNNIRAILIDSFRNINKQEMKFEVYAYILGAIDLCSNEYTANWIGHQKNFQIENRLIDMNYNELNKILFKDLTSYTDFIHQNLSSCRSYYPSWIYQIKYQLYSLDLKIKKLMSEIKKIYFKEDSFYQKDKITQRSYSDLPTGQGLFNENQKNDGQEFQLKTMAMLLFIDDEVQPKDVQFDSQKPYITVQQQKQYQNYQKEKYYSQIGKVESQINLEQAKIIDQKYFQHLKIIIIEYKKVLNLISRRNSILESRFRNINWKNQDEEKIKNYNYFKIFNLQEEEEELNINLMNLKIKIDYKKTNEEEYQFNKQFLLKSIENMNILKLF
ncbi:unnamed protein product [Paramecium sonneborni]|uniref:Uncharacterized protein n=1 Tax=Paramecium sonneborni TaxID=65129 RepID=A0A8S1LC01_9CILI|nr:unnamed protein product [Paramecium sonneborni]